MGMRAYLRIKVRATKIAWVVFVRLHGLRKPMSQRLNKMQRQTGTSASVVAKGNLSRKIINVCRGISLSLF